jgi:hypothetical protein
VPDRRTSKASHSAIVIELQPRHIARAVHDANDDGLGIGDAKVDIVTPVDSKTESGPDIVTRHTTVAYTCNALQMPVEHGNEPTRCSEIGDAGKMVIDLIEILPSPIG